VKAVVVEKGEKVHIQCDQCGTVLEGDAGDAPPEVCPECGR
jgi:rubrerythrin